ncbi:hypothetical protein L2E82_18469 [Cichorium intybus]|uniref:Uncharacterized protein n=1 Tax=Cichorium intybus TaxID=13427 RepID=A0ACB9F9J7_CICIN|nr:hypothetical protein L2E82_18469 [Cichorium intybus]
MCSYPKGGNGSGFRWEMGCGTGGATLPPSLELWVRKICAGNHLPTGIPTVSKSGTLSVETQESCDSSRSKRRECPGDSVILLHVCPVLADWGVVEDPDTATDEESQQKLESVSDYSVRRCVSGDGGEVYR